MNLVKNIKSIFSPTNIYAHCDIPCGIYDPIAAKIAAQTVLKMVMKMEDIDLSGGVSRVEQPNTVARFIRVKEDHAQEVKNELNILWSDYFKPEHLEKYPDLHEKIWNACKLGSFVKVNVDLGKAKEFQSALEEIGEIFWETKK